MVPYGTSRVHASSHAVSRSGSGAASLVASTTTSAPTTASRIDSATRIGLPNASSSVRAKSSRDSGRLLVTRISSKSKKWSSMITLENAVPRAPMCASTFESRRPSSRPPSAVSAPVRRSVISVASTIASGTPVRGSKSVTRASSDGSPAR